MRRAWLIAVLAACSGDDLTLGFDAVFEGGDARFFGTTSEIGPPPMSERTPHSGTEVCLNASCAMTDATGTFVLTGPPAPHESLFSARAFGLLPMLVAVTAGAAGDRNVGTVPLQRPDLFSGAAAAYGEDLNFGEHGAVLVLTERYDEGAIELAIDGTTARYLGKKNLPDPTLTSVEGAVLFFGIPPGEVLLRTTVGRCEPIRDGWPTATLGEIRLPIQAGHITLLRPQCLGNI
jgi:hypothetical protein